MNVVNEAPTEAVPTLISIEVAGAILGLGRMPAYLATWRGDLPIVHFGRHKRVPTARLESIVGRPITVADVHRAERTVSARKAAKSR